MLIMIYIIKKQEIEIENDKKQLMYNYKTNK